MGAPATISLPQLRAFGRDAFERAGLNGPDADTGAEVLSTTDAWGSSPTAPRRCAVTCGGCGPAACGPADDQAGEHGIRLPSDVLASLRESAAIAGLDLAGCLGADS